SRFASAEALRVPPGTVTHLITTWNAFLVREGIHQPKHGRDRHADANGNRKQEEQKNWHPEHDRDEWGQIRVVLGVSEKDYQCGNCHQSRGTKQPPYESHLKRIPRAPTIL